MSCNCGRSREVVTSVQVSAEIAERQRLDAEANAAAMVASVANAVANATGANSGSNGWYLVEDTPS